MNLYILTSGGRPLKHPLTESNLLLLIPTVDLENLPDGVCKFVRVPKPVPGPYEVLVSTEPSYQIIDGICYDVWHMRDMTDEEKQEKIRILQEGIPAPSWTTDIENYTWHPPVPYPDDYMVPDTDIVNYTWNEDIKNWERFTGE